MTTATSSARRLFNGPSPRLGSLFHTWLAGWLALLSLGVAVLPTMETLQSPLTAFGARLNSHQSTSSESVLAELVRLTRERRTLVARQLHSASQSSEELAQLHVNYKNALDRLLNMADAAVVAKLDLQSLKADWALLERDTANTQLGASELFALHSQLIDKQLALLSTLASESI